MGRNCARPRKAIVGQAANDTAVSHRATGPYKPAARIASSAAALLLEPSDRWAIVSRQSCPKRKSARCLSLDISRLSEASCLRCFLSRIGIGRTRCRCRAMRRRLTGRSCGFGPRINAPKNSAGHHDANHRAATIGDGRDCHSISFQASDERSCPGDADCEAEVVGSRQVQISGSRRPGSLRRQSDATGVAGGLVAGMAAWLL